MRIAIGCDHGGFELKNILIEHLKKQGHIIQDCGAYALDLADDYPDSSKAVGEKIQKGEVERGILLCGSGVGASIAANKMIGIRAALCHDNYSAHQGVEDDDMNVLCLGGRVIDQKQALELTTIFLAAKFNKEERFVRRLQKVAKMEKHTP